MNKYKIISLAEIRQVIFMIQEWFYANILELRSELWYATLSLFMYTYTSCCMCQIIVHFVWKRSHQVAWVVTSPDAFRVVYEEWSYSSNFWI